MTRAELAKIVAGRLVTLGVTAGTPKATLRELVGSVLCTLEDSPSTARETRDAISTYVGLDDFEGLTTLVRLTERHLRRAARHHA